MCAIASHAAKLRVSAYITSCRLTAHPPCPDVSSQAAPMLLAGLTNPDVLATVCTSRRTAYWWYGLKHLPSATVRHDRGGGTSDSFQSLSASMYAWGCKVKIDFVVPLAVLANQQTSPLHWQCHHGVTSRLEISCLELHKRRQCQNSVRVQTRWDACASNELVLSAQTLRHRP